MLEVQQGALQLLAEILDRAGAAEDRSVRLSEDEDGELRLVFDEERPGDRVLSHRERSVLLLAPTVELALDGGELGVTGEGRARHLTFRPADGG